MSFIVLDIVRERAIGAGSIVVQVVDFVYAMRDSGFVNEHVFSISFYGRHFLIFRNETFYMKYSHQYTQHPFDQTASRFMRALTKLSFFLLITVAMTCSSHAVPNAIPALQTIGNLIIPYLQWLVPLAGGCIMSINGWRCFNNGQPKAGVYAIGGAGITCLGFTGLFGADSATLII